MANNTRRGLATLSTVGLVVASLSACAEQPEELVYDCVVQEQANGDYTVIDPKECDSDGNGYASTHGGAYPLFFYHGGGSYYTPGNTIPRASVAASSLALANNPAAKSAAQNSVSKATGLKAGSNGVTAGKKGGFGFSGGGRGGGGG